MAAKPYNGHHCWNCWNVSLWISNEEPLYRAAVDYSRRIPNSGAAARAFIRDWNLTRTPDGAEYTLKAVRHAIVGLSE